jgi:hypothetical protein
MVLDRLCEIEAEWKHPVAKDGGPVILGVRADWSNPAKWNLATDTKSLPYRKLRNLLNPEKTFDQDIEGGAGEGRSAVRALDKLPIVSGFSVYQVIDGCAQAIKFAAEVKKHTELSKRLRFYRNTHPLTKNTEKIHQRSVQMLKAALTVNPNVSLAGNVLSLSVDGNAATEISELSRTAIRQNKYGCIYYQTDRLNNHPPTPTALLAFNLEWIFRHWPLNKETFPIWPPRKQQRCVVKQNCYKPRRDIVAHFINAIFNPSENKYDRTTIKDYLKIPANAQFCGW